MTLGELIKKARKERNLTAKQVLKHTGLKGSVSLFSQWETNQKIPTPLDLRVLCKFLDLDLNSVFFLWAEAQMPTPALKSIFKLKNNSHPTSDILEPIAYPSAITQQIREADASWFTQYPDAGTILVKCLMLTNEERPSSVDVLTKELSMPMDQIAHYCKELIDRKYLVKEGENFRTKQGIKYLYLPETEEFEEMRRGRIKVNLDRALQSITPRMIFDRQAVRLTIFKKMPPDKVKYFVDNIEALANEMISRVDSNSTDSQYHQLICVFGPEK